MKKIAVCFFGITRSLKFTHQSIKDNVLAPARASGEVKVFAHFFNQKIVRNRRTHEDSELDLNDRSLLPLDFLDIEEPDECLDLYDFDLLKNYGDTRRDGFQSFKNLVHALHSQKRVGLAALSWKPDLVIFARPDLLYHDSLGAVLNDIEKDNLDNIISPGVTIPDWQHWRGGYNDRFAICAGQAAISAYSQRVDMMHRYCIEMREPIHSESLLRYSLNRAGISVSYMPVRASRVRANGRVQAENFGESKIDHIKTCIRKARRKLLNIPEL